MRLRRRCRPHWHASRASALIDFVFSRRLVFGVYVDYVELY